MLGRQSLTLYPFPRRLFRSPIAVSVGLALSITLVVIQWVIPVLFRLLVTADCASSSQSWRLSPSKRLCVVDRPFSSCRCTLCVAFEGVITTWSGSLFNSEHSVPSVLGLLSDKVAAAELSFLLKRKVVSSLLADVGSAGESSVSAQPSPPSLLGVVSSDDFLRSLSDSMKKRTPSDLLFGLKSSAPSLDLVDR